MANKLLPLITVLFLLIVSCGPKEGEENYLKFKKLKDTQEYFSYKSDSTILVSGNRGGLEVGFPENSIEGFEHVLTQIPVFFKVDPRLTKDSVIVLMQDETLDRTTNAMGSLSDYSWDELQAYRLKDSEGNITAAMIPKLEDVFDWNKNKTIINLDKKDVPLEMMVDIIKKNKIQKYVMLTTYTGAQARYYHDNLPGVMLSVYARNDAEYEDIAISGVPWDNVIAYVGQRIDDSNRHIVEKLHAKGVRCMVSFASTHDRLGNTEQRMAAYIKEVENSVYRPDIIESDYPIDVWNIYGNKKSAVDE